MRNDSSFQKQASKKTCFSRWSTEGPLRICLFSTDIIMVDAPPNLQLLFRPGLFLVATHDKRIKRTHTWCSWILPELLSTSPPSSIGQPCGGTPCQQGFSSAAMTSKPSRGGVTVICQVPTSHLG